MIAGWERRTAIAAGERAELVIENGAMLLAVPIW